MARVKTIDSYMNILKENREYYEVSKSLIEQGSDMSKAEKYYYAIWAPVITEYVKWVLDEAVKDGVTRLYFLARDAYPMYVAATRLLGDYGTRNVECRYLRVSRQAMRVPEYHLIGRDAVDLIFISGIDVTFRKICNRARLTEEEINSVGEILGIKNVDQILNRREILALREKARNCDQFAKCVNAHSKEEYESTIEYLKQEGLMDGIKVAVVDSGWVGTLQRSIERLVRSYNPSVEIKGYYFGLYEWPIDTDRNKYSCYYFAPDKKLIRKSRFANCIFEAIYSENMPMTTGYDIIGDMVIPSFSDVLSLNSEQLEENIGYLNNWLNEYLSRCGHYSKRSRVDKHQIAVSRWVERILSSIMSRPDEWEVAYYGMYQFADDVNDVDYRDIAPEMSRKDIDSLRIIPKLMIMMGLSKRELHESAWIEGSCVNSGNYGISAMRRSKLLTVARQQVRQICLKR